MIQTLGYILELIGAIAGFTMTYIILKKDKSYIGNKFMAATTALIGGYDLCVFIYDIIATYWVIHVFYRMGLISMMFGIMQSMVIQFLWWRISEEGVLLIRLVQYLKEVVVLPALMRVEIHGLLKHVT